MLINDFMHIHDVLLTRKLDTELPNSLNFWCFLYSSFLSKVRSTYGNISMAPSFLIDYFKRHVFL
jgi:hypothetical protein